LFWWKEVSGKEGSPNWPIGNRVGPIWIGAWAATRSEPSDHFNDKERQRTISIEATKTYQEKIFCRNLYQCRDVQSLLYLPALPASTERVRKMESIGQQRINNMSCFCINLGSLSRSLRAWFKTHQLSQGFKSCRGFSALFSPGISLTNRCSAAWGPNLAVSA